jgi:hypothetical protein
VPGSGESVVAHERRRAASFSLDGAGDTAVFAAGQVGYDEGGNSMKHWLGRLTLGVSLAVVLLVGLGEAQRGGGQDGPSLPPKSDDVRLPNGKLQKDEILKAEHEQNLRDSAQLTELAQQLQQELEKDDRFVLSMSTLKKIDDIEKLAKKIHTRLRHN